MKRFRLLFLSTFLLPCLSFAQSEVYRDNISNLFVTSFEEDSQGHIWMGTRRGLCRFDGTSYLTFQASSVPGSLNNDYIYDLCLDEYGIIWASTKSGIVSYYDGQLIVDDNDNTLISYCWPL